MPIQVLRFNPIQIAEWLADLLPADSLDQGENRQTLGQQLHIPKYRVTQFLALLEFPSDLRVRLKEADWIAEGHLRPFTRLGATRQRLAIERMLGLGAMAKAG